MTASWWVSLAAAAIVSASASAATAVAQGELTPEAAAQQVAESYGVEVLDVAEADEDGRPVYIVTVMNPGDNSNGAFQVNRLMVDRATGELVSQFRHGAAGYTLPGGGGATTGADGRMIRRLSHHPESVAQGGR